MDSCVLHPPNSRILSDDVINVKTRSGQPASFLVATSASRMNQQRDLHDDHAFSGQPTAMTRYSHREANTPQVDRIPPTNKKIILSKTRQLQAQDASITELLVMGKMVVRERRSINERRYRKMNDDRKKSLEEDTHQLRKRIKQLEQRQSNLRLCVLQKNSIWSVAVAYLQIFCNGLSLDSFGAPDAVLSRAQFDFVQAALSPNVVFNGGCGTEALLESWRCLSLSFQNIKIEVEGLTKESSHSVIATTRTCFTLTGQTVRKVFPHLWNLDTEDANLALLAKLLGQNIVMLGQTRFEWGGLGGRYVTTAMAQSDFLTPVLRLVGGLESVSRVFEKSHISPDFVWKLDETGINLQENRPSGEDKVCTTQL